MGHPPTTDLNFTGMNQDTASNVYDFPAREYGIQGRWPSPDAAGLAAVNPMDPQTWNRYAYVRNSPLELVDPLGLDSCGAIVCIIVDPPPPPPSDPCDLPGVCDAPPGSPNPGGPQGGGSNGTSSSPSHPAPLAPCSLSIGQRVSLGIQGTLNAAIASKKAAGGLLIGAAGVGLGPFSDGTSLFGTAVGSYMVTTAAGQGLVAANQLNQAYTGQGGPENQTQRLGILLSGPISSSVVLASNGSVATAERMAKYESIGTNGIGIFSSSTVSELLETSADAVLSTLGIHDLGTCTGD